MTDAQYRQHITSAKQALRTALDAAGLTPTAIVSVLVHHSQVHAALDAYQRALIEGYDAHMATLQRADMATWVPLPSPIEDAP